MIRFQKRVILDSVRFDPNSAVLDGPAKNCLDTVYEKLLQYPSVKVKFVGHTDDIGGEDSNLDLSIRRAASVRDFLIAKGIDVSRLTHVGRGEVEPLKPNTSEVGRQVNRRVELEVIE